MYSFSLNEEQSNDQVDRARASEHCAKLGRLWLWTTWTGPKGSHEGTGVALLLCVPRAGAALRHIKTSQGNAGVCQPLPEALQLTLDELLRDFFMNHQARRNPLIGGAEMHPNRTQFRWL